MTDEWQQADLQVCDKIREVGGVRESSTWMNLKNAYMWILAGKDGVPFIMLQLSAVKPTQIFLSIHLPVTLLSNDTLHPSLIYSSSAFPPLLAGNIFKRKWMHALQLFHSLALPRNPPFCLHCSVGAVSAACSDTHTGSRQTAGPCALKGSG